MATAKTKLHRLVKDIKHHQKFMMAPMYVDKWCNEVENIIETLKDEKRKRDE